MIHVRMDLGEAHFIYRLFYSSLLHREPCVVGVHYTNCVNQLFPYI